MCNYNYALVNCSNYDIYTEYHNHDLWKLGRFFITRILRIKCIIYFWQ